MKQTLELTPLQVKYLLQLVNEDEANDTESRYMKQQVKPKLQELRNDFARVVGKEIDDFYK